MARCATTAFAVVALMMALLGQASAGRSLHAEPEAARTYGVDPMLAEPLVEAKLEEVLQIGSELKGVNAYKFVAPTAADHCAQGQFLAAFKEGTTEAQVADVTSTIEAADGRVKRVVSGNAWNGAAFKLPTALDKRGALLQSLVDTEHVTLVECNQIFTVNQPGDGGVSSQAGATWGLDRIDQAAKTLNSRYDYTSTGAGVCAYVVDTGVYRPHNEIAGRVLAGYNVYNAAAEPDDDYGHGTHVAGTIAGTTYGVAKKATIVPVKVLDQGSGTTDAVVSGINWVVSDKSSGCPKGKVINMSLGGGTSTAIDQAVGKATAAGVVVAVAAGNENQDACNVSPARSPTAITVGATTSSDARASFSNYGTCVDIFAPGQGITSSWLGSATATNTISGTSMATPHVAGVLCRLMSAGDCNSSSTCTTKLIGMATSNAVTGAGAGSPNKLLFVAPSA